jgi:hypothetical protein
MTEVKIIMKAIVVTDEAAGTAGMKLVDRPDPLIDKRCRRSGSCVGIHLG